MIILSIDPGFDRVGIAVIEKKGSKDTLLFSECFQTNKKDSFPARLAAVVDRVEKHIKTHKPKVIALEKVFFAKNQKTAFGVSQVCGAISYIAEKMGLVICEYTPTEIKSSLAGDGRADKKQIQKMVTLLLPNTIKDKCLDDEYDAIAVGLVCSSNIKETL